MLTPGDPAPVDSDRVALLALVADYARHLDAADFDQFADLFREGTWLGMRGPHEVRDWLRENVILYDGRTHALHLVEEVDLVVAADGLKARGFCRMTVRQTLPGRAPFTVTTNTYADAFVKVGSSWRFESRVITSREPGDDSMHRRRQDGAARPSWDSAGTGN